MKNSQMHKGILFGIISYIIWGLLPIYWKALEQVRADVVFSHRIIWSCLFILIYITVSKRLPAFLKELKRILAHKKVFLSIVLASFIIGSNWLVYIWAVQQNYMIQVSLGYYINPLMSVLLGVIVLKERLSKSQQLSVLLATIGVLYLTIRYQVFPWIALVLAITFALYGLLKKMAHLDATFSLMIETSVLLPFALIYLIIQFGAGLGFEGDLASNALLLGSGIATAVPLLLFGVAVLFMPLSLTGILQYIAPTLMLLLGVFLYKESFTLDHLIAFFFIWTSVLLFITSSIKEDRKARKERVENGNLDVNS